ncbi:PLC-like phosphodiesterase [Hymenopellis radicata]|nr:PLC-like phosphodiesterase [Hymenopellis radicata]
MAKARILPDCWGHRGASAAFPENTLASFEAAMRDGAEGIESDLRRTTNSSGLIKERNWYGEGGMEHVRTIKKPVQSIPTFAETIALLMRPENQHVKFNVDVKPQNEPEKLFKLLSEIIESHPNWETVLAPRILLGLWHPRFLSSAKSYLPHCRRSHIGESLAMSRKYFWDDCHVFSVRFSVLASADGQKFREECKAANKQVMVWTVNRPEQMMEAVRWGVDVILTDVTKTWLDLRNGLQVDYEKIGSQYGRIFLWTTPDYYTPFQMLLALSSQKRLESQAGPFEMYMPTTLKI